MEVQHSVTGLKQIIAEQKSAGKIIGFVPTMGALHKGHLSLVEQACNTANFVVVSIFVNPTQFNNKNDLLNYPRTVDADLKLLKETCCQLVFIPSVEEMYPEPDTREFSFGNMDSVMEGQHRPGHFSGVAQVVSKLFDMVQPDKAFFGEKDFQQLAIIRNLTLKLGYPIEIIACPTVRETDGLAMSSRNIRLSQEQRANATLISQCLFKLKEKAGAEKIEIVKKWVVDTIDANPFLETEYFELIDALTLQPINDWVSNINKVACIAVHCGDVRLIDNITFD